MRSQGPKNLLLSCDSVFFSSRSKMIPRFILSYGRAVATLPVVIGTESNVRLRSENVQQKRTKRGAHGVQDSGETGLLSLYCTDGKPGLVKNSLQRLWHVGYGGLQIWSSDGSTKFEGALYCKMFWLSEPYNTSNC